MILNTISSNAPQPLDFRLSFPLARLLSQCEPQTLCATNWLVTAQRQLMLLPHFFFYISLNRSPLRSSQSLLETTVQI